MFLSLIMSLKLLNLKLWKCQNLSLFTHTIAPSKLRCGKNQISTQFLFKNQEKHKILLKSQSNPLFQLEFPL